MIDDLALPEDSLLNYPRQIALLLPLSGNGAAAGSAIRNGFIGAYFGAIGGADSLQRVRIYDVNGEAGVTGAYFADCREKRPKPWAQDDAEAEKLWQFSEEITGFRYPV